MKKYLPLFIATFFLGGFLIHQVALDGFDASRAVVSSKAKDKTAHYENIFSKLKLKDYKGKSINLKSSKIVIMNFWASWCGPCVEELPSLVKMKSKFGDKDLIVVGINNDEKTPTRSQKGHIKETVKKFKINFQNYADKDSVLTSRFLIDGLPVTIIFKAGKVVYISNGALDFNSEEFIGQMKEHLKK